MLGWVVTFLIIALIAGVLGFGGIAGASIEIAKIIFVIALVLFLVSAVFGIVRGRRISLASVTGPYVNPSFHLRDIRSPGSCFCTGSARRPPPDGVREDRSNQSSVRVVGATT